MRASTKVDYKTHNPIADIDCNSHTPEDFHAAVSSNKLCEGFCTTNTALLIVAAIFSGTLENMHAMHVVLVFVTVVAIHLDLWVEGRWTVETGQV
jgi:hypothetical protein